MQVVALETRPVLALDADGALHGKPSCPPPDPPAACARHVLHRGGIQEATPGEPAQGAKLHRASQGFRIWGLEAGGLVEPDSVLDVAGDHAVEGQDVVMAVRI